MKENKTVSSRDTRAHTAANEPGVWLRCSARQVPQSLRWEFSQESPLSSALHRQKAARCRSLSLSKQAQAYLKGSVSISKYYGRQVDSNKSSPGSPESLNGCYNCQRQERRSFLSTSHDMTEHTYHMLMTSLPVLW